MRIAKYQQQQLVSRAAIAEMAGVQRSAITNWERRYTDFPSPTRAGGIDYYYLSDVLTWLKGRPVPPRARRDDERPDATYADRARTALIAASEAEAVEDLEAEGFPAARGTAGDETDGEHFSSADVLFREQDEGYWGSGSRVSFLYLLFSLIYLRWAQPRRWAVVRRAAAQGQAGTHIHRFLPGVAQQVEQTLAAQGVTSAMAVRLEDLTPRSPQAIVRLLGKIESLGRGSFAELLGHYALEAGLGSRDAFTPPGVARLLAALLGESSSAQSLYDPNGRGGELLSAVLAARPEPGNEVSGGIPAVTIGSAHPETRDLAAMNLMVHGARPEWLNLAGATRPWTEGPRRHRADLVLTNPPFNVSAVPVDADWWTYGEPPASNANLAWPQYAVMSLNEGGRAAVLMPNSAATSSNLKEQRIRHALVDRGAVECVIALPAKMFSATTISVNVWILKPETQERSSGEVLFIDASGLATKVSRKLSVLEADDCALIAAAYHSWRGTGGNNAVLPDSRLPCAAVRRDTVNAAGSSLRPADYARPARRSNVDTEELTDPYGALLRSREEAGRADDLADSRVAGFRHVDGGLGVLIDTAPDDWEWRSLGELCELQAGPSPSLLPKGAYVPGGVVPVVQPKHLRDRRVADVRGTAVPYDKAQRLRRFALQEGDILCARTGTVGPVAHVRSDQAGWLFGSNLIRLHRFAPEVCPAYLLAYLSLSRTTEWIKSRSEKTTVPSISKADLQALPVHLPAWSEQKRIAGALGALDEQIARHLEVARAATQVHKELAERLVGLVALQGPTAPSLVDTFPERTSR
ncbi:N-6 DNA methylase [Streptomyces laculatispora]|uniref:N-6 DNA methylase n=1 Tax=Streptomyces laculatispora TaxID=887464 RepID=A0ABY9I869_9ACTN|nr:type I restriction-modification system subunit M/S [Streptomyces laculatispora]WLQ41836.1 N-6 DNA methylase [Streptomyces laculatispora]